LSSNVAVLGLGYVGSVTAACLAKLGHKVVGVDRDEFKVDCIRNATSPFFEPGLEALIQDVRGAGRLTAMTSTQDALADAEVALLCVGTPSERNGNISTDQLRRSALEIAEAVKDRTKPLVVAVRSTAFPGTCQDIVAATLGSPERIKVVCNPEFLREGSAVNDFLHPALLVVGGTDMDAMRLVAGLYDGLPVEPSLVELRTAELIKYACNAFHAVKITFANEIGALAGALDVAGEEVMQVLCKDNSLNTSAAYLKPRFAFGGSCLPKDLRALTFRATRLNLQLPLLNSVLPANNEQLNRAVEILLARPAERCLGFYGLAFKENTDDLRESPVVAMIEHMIGKGRTVIVHDPHIQLGKIYGKNLNFVLSAVPHIGRLMTPSLDELLARADDVVITQKPSAQAAEVLNASGKVILDLSRAWAPKSN
jgi:GDP-mannose 6-dehydrogenase